MDENNEWKINNLPSKLDLIMSRFKSYLWSFFFIVFECYYFVSKAIDFFIRYYRVLDVIISSIKTNYPI